MTPVAVPGPGALKERISRDVDRAVRRGRNGLRYAAGTKRLKVGQTPKDVIWQQDKAQLWRYRGNEIRYRQPLVIVHSLVSRSYVLDLYPGNSVVGFLQNAGFEVLLLDWGEADEVDSHNTLETYVDGYIPAALAAARDVTGCDDVTAMGYCMGGLLALLAVARDPDLPVHNLVTMATPIDFGPLWAATAMLREGRLEPDDVLDDTGNVPADAIARGFKMLTPTADLVQYATLWQNLWNDEYVDGFQAMAQWAGDHVPFPGATMRQLVEDLIRRNALVEGTLRLGGRDVDLGAVTCPVLNVLAEFDHIVPTAGSEPLTRLVGSEDAEELRLKAGHVGLVAGRAANKISLPHIAAWMQAHSDPIEEAG
jgi:polyhydroxyalkanoate synthase subunit PhaC